MVDGTPRTARAPSAHRRKPEDTAQGCRDMAAADRGRARDTSNAHKRGTFGRSADAWDSRANLLERLETSASKRAADESSNDFTAERNEDGQGTGPIEQGEAQAEGERRQRQERTRPRIKGLSSEELPDRREEDAD